MAKSKRQTPRYQIAAGSPGSEASSEGERAEKDKEALSISLKHYNEKHQCFGSWKPEDMKRFSSTIRQMRTLTRNDLNRTNIISKVRNQNGWQLNKPKSVDRELPIYELRIGKSSNLRAFGVMPESVFYLIWLDRSHGVF